MNKYEDLKNNIKSLDCNLDLEQRLTILDLLDDFEFYKNMATTLLKRKLAVEGFIYKYKDLSEREKKHYCLEPISIIENYLKGDPRG